MNKYEPQVYPVVKRGGAVFHNLLRGYSGSKKGKETIIAIMPVGHHRARFKKGSRVGSVLQRHPENITSLEIGESVIQTKFHKNEKCSVIA